jgi:predicted nuclease with TOPRIM domain
MANQTIEPQQAFSFPEFWQSLVELREQMAESRKEHDRLLAEADRRIAETNRLQKETAEQMKETDRRMEETARQMKLTDKKIGDLGNRFGELAEHMVGPSINEKFNALGYHFDAMSPNREVFSPDGKSAEIDIYLENDEFSIAIEVKSKPLEKDVDRHVERMGIIRRHADKHHDTRKLQGAIAGAIMAETVRNYALKAGFYVITQSGDTVEIDVPEGFKPREW